MASYASAADLLARHDARTVGDLAGDIGVPIRGPDLAAHPNVATALQRASGTIEAALLAGGRYTAADLAGLTDNALEWLKGLVCDQAFVFLARRRPDYLVEMTEAITSYVESELDALRSGKHILPIAKAVEASVPTSGGPTTVEINQMNLRRNRATGYFPRQRLPDNR
ncbi:MAG: hypothetical protein AB7U73_01305 [Pirellulales bacterium]